MGSTLAHRIWPYWGWGGGGGGGVWFLEKGNKGPNMNHLDTNPSHTQSKKIGKRLQQ